MPNRHKTTRAMPDAVTIAIFGVLFAIVALSPPLWLLIAIAAGCWLYCKAQDRKKAQP